MKAAGRRLKSLQAQLLLPLLALVSVIWLGAAILTWVDARHELDELLDGHLAQAAALLVVQQAQADSEDHDGVADAPTLHKYAPKVAFQVFHEGRLVMRSANTALVPMSSKASGFATVQLAGDAEWRVFATRGAERDVQVFVGEQTASRNAILSAVLGGVLLPLVFALPLLALGGWWVVRQGLAPLRHLSLLLRQRQAQVLDPVVLSNTPTELEPTVQALNDLLARIDHLLASERRFTADAAHELRTPIAGIRAQTQVALGAGADEVQRQHALQATLAGCDRATRLVEQLLTLARLETQSADLTGAVVDLCAVTRQTAANLAPTALMRRQTLELDASSPCPVPGNDTLVTVLVRNLIDNALRYSPDGAQICVSVSITAGQPTLCVQDSGPGMTDDQVARLGERFFRVLGHERPGSGLGWSIVQRIGAVFDAQIQVSRSELLGGLAVTVRWPRQQNLSP